MMHVKEQHLGQRKNKYWKKRIKRHGETKKKKKKSTSIILRWGEIVGGGRWCVYKKKESGRYSIISVGGARGRSLGRSEYTTTGGGGGEVREDKKKKKKKKK